VAFFQKLQPCLVGIEACATSHHWSRELRALGHTVRLMPPAYVNPYVKRQKNDAADAEAISEAVTRAYLLSFPGRAPPALRLGLVRAIARPCLGQRTMTLTLLLLSIPYWSQPCRFRHLIWSAVVALTQVWQ
jgi:hypothetical protein